MEKTPKPWPGALKQLLQTVSDFTKVLDVKDWNSKAQGQQPWIVSMKAWQWRWGPNAWTMPGVACCVMALTKHVVVTCVPLEGLLQNGIHPNDIAAHLETDTGKTFWKEQCHTIRLGVGSVAYIPMGWAVSPLCAPGDGQDDKFIAHILSFSILSPDLAKQCDKTIVTAIKKFNEMH